MGLHFTDFKLRGVDVSQYNGVINWPLLAEKANYVAIRVGYGNTIDPKFVQNIEAAMKTNADIFIYFYSDYYSNWFNTKSTAYGMSDKTWGIRQADNCLKWIAPYMSRIKAVYLDIENITDLTFPMLTDPKAKIHSMGINQAFLEHLDEKKVPNGIYASLGWLSWFDDWFRTRPLWVAFYPYRTANVDIDDVIYMCAKNGWKVKPLIWQYAMDGDADDNGTGDGISYFGTSSKTLDLNGWIGSDGQYESLFGQPVIVVPEEPINKAGEYIVKASPYCFIRSGMSAATPKLGLYYTGTKVKIMSAMGDWGSIEGQKQYIYLGCLDKI